MAHWKKIAIHVLLWAIPVTYVASELHRAHYAEQRMVFWEGLVSISSAIALFYYCYLVAWPCFNHRGKRWHLVVLLVLAPTVYWMCWYALYRLVYLAAGLPPVIGRYEDAMKHSPDNIMWLIFISGAVWGLQEIIRRNRENKLLQKENEKVEMDYLRTQFNPHFLFNMLNSLYYSASKVSDKFADHVKRIADLMEYAIRVNQDGLVELDTEVAHIRNYTELFRMRFTPSFHVDVEVQGDTAGLRIPPLLLIPFVENAFKHGLVNDPQQPVQVRIKVMNKRLEFSVRNLIHHYNKESTRGVGLPSIKRRLELIYPGRHSLQILEKAGVYFARLHIDL